MNYASYEIDGFDSVSELTPAQERQIDRMLSTGSSFRTDELPYLVEAVHEAWSERGYRSIQCAGAVRRLCEAWEEMLG